MTAIALPKLSEPRRRNVMNFRGWRDTRSGSTDTAWRTQHEIKFDVLTANWLSDIRGISDVDEIIENRNYQEIINMGWLAVPLILRQLQIAPKQWFYALENITGDVLGADCIDGDVEALADVWLAWGRARGLV
jgi:hypothetical protein